MLKNLRFARKQIYAFLLVLLFGLLPFVALGVSQGLDSILFYYAFGPKTQSCESAFDVPQNSTVEGAASLFVLDASFGRFTFAQAKAIDVAWDILVGRGVQLVAWTVSYIVFSDAIVRLIERQPASFRLFRRIGLEGASLNSAWALLKELFKRRSKQTWALFSYLLLSTLYVLSIPAFLSAMTGYDSRTIPWVSIGPDANNIVPASYFEPGSAALGTWNATFEQPICLDSNVMPEWYSLEAEKRSNC
jgi:hypothetical protein